jgi:Ca2+-binding RTX toxin-like protein
MVAFFFLIYNNRGGDYQTLQIQTYHSKKKTMTVTLNYSQLAGPNGAFFDANSSTIAQVLNTLPNAIIYTPLATPPTSDNLTFIGLFNDGSGDSVWRITNAGPAVSGVTLESTSPGFLNNSLSLTANSFTYVRSTVSGTHRLITSGVGGGTFVKDDGPTIISLGNPPAPAGQTTIGRVNSNVPYNITGSNFNDTLFGGGNTDSIDGGAGNDIIAGNQGNDTLLGGIGNDSILGGSGNDTINGGDGDDTIFGGAFGDTLTGGTGADRFAYSNANNEGGDTIIDFTTAQLDFIQISASGPGFAGSGLVPGLLPGVQFFSSATAGPGSGDANTRFIYNTTNGNLWFDRDGTGATASVQLATLTNLPAAFDHSYIVIV